MTKEISDISEFQGSLRRLSFLGSSAVALFAGTVGIWAIATTFSGAVVTPGQFVVEGNVKKVQHLTGGIVSEIRVREGDLVEQDQVLVRLDDTIARASLQVITKQLDEIAARRGRLEAERDHRDWISIAPEIAARATETEISELIDAEKNLFVARRVAREGQKAQLAKRIGQLADEKAGLKAQQVSRDLQAILIEQELEAVRDLHAKNLVSLTRKTTLEREAANLEGRKGQLLASIAQVEGRAAETQLQIIQIDDTLREEVMKELREIQSKSGELIERRLAAVDQLKRTEIRAPAAGVVHQQAVHTVGGVISPAEPAMLIVPLQDALQVEIRINPSDIDQIRVGDQARVKIHAFNQRTTPELNGAVSLISADTTRDQQSSPAYYLARVSVSPLELSRIAPNHVSAGMQAEVFVQTESRTPLEYIVKPLKDQIARAFRER